MKKHTIMNIIFINFKNVLPLKQFYMYEKTYNNEFIIIY